MIEIRKLSQGFLKKSLFQNVTLRFLPGERYGIVGANGSGKSTLLKILAGELEADGGDVDRKAGIEVYRIGQDHNLNDQLSIIDTAMMGRERVFNAFKKKEALLKLDVASDDLATELAALEEVIRQNDGYRLGSDAASVLEGLGILQADQHKALSTLSGGYKWRVFLAQALIKNPEVLMLDEPTNHLDIISIRWLELFLSNYRGLVILVSHDKRFMDNVCTQILDIDFDTITAYSGNYAAFEKARHLFIAQKESEIVAQEKDIKNKQEFVERFRYKASKARQAQSRLKQIEKMQIIEPIRTSRIHPNFRFDVDEIGSKEVLSVKSLKKSYGGKKILDGVNFEVRRKDKIAIIGPNGSGKSTLLKALALEFPECGESIAWGHGTDVGYFAQDCGAKVASCRESALSWLWRHCADKPQSFVQGYLGRALFSQDDAQKNTKDLSGGELGRLYLAYLMMKKPNVLLLDEPTNHLDVESIESLASSLCAFKGTLIVVSHDRTFIEQVASRIIEVTPNGVKDYLGTYSEFITSKDHDYLDAAQEINAKKLEKNKNCSSNEVYLEQKKRKAKRQKVVKLLDKLMAQVEDVERDIKAIDLKFLDQKFFEDNDFEKVAKLERQKEALTIDLQDLLKKWEQAEKSLVELTNDAEA